MNTLMSMGAIIFILNIVILFLVIKIFLMKKEMRRVTSEMKNNPDNNQMSVDFVDRDLQKMIIQINSLYESVMKIKVEGKADEKKIRESISMIAHDMRTPLTSIIGYLQVAERSDDYAEKNAYIDIALERAKYLNKLVNDFFELSLIESGQVNVQMEKVNLSEIICEEILSESPEIDRKGIEPVFEQAEENIYVYADKKKLERVIQNLISNAVKYSVKKLEFVIGIEEAPVITLRIITDATESINTDKIFDRFYQQDSSRTKGGAGLGLYICKSFVEMMYGSISAKQEGDLFEIDLKLAKNEKVYNIIKLMSSLYFCSSSASDIIVTLPKSYSSVTQSYIFWIRESVFGSSSSPCFLRYSFTQNATPATPEVFVIDTLGGRLRRVSVSNIL